jgi:hypothetical protein
MLIGHLLEVVVDFLIDNRVLLDPANLAFLGFDVEKAAAVLDDFEGLPVCDFGNDVRNRRNSIVEKGLPRRDVDHLFLWRMETVAARERYEQPDQAAQNC